MKAKIKKHLIENNLAAPADGLLLRNSKVYNARYTAEGQFQVFYYKWRFAYSYDFDVFKEKEKK